MKKIYDRLFKHNRGIELFVVFMTFIFAPLELYFSSRAEFWFKPGDFVPYLGIIAILGLLIWLIVDVICESCFDSVWQIIRYAVFLCYLAIYIQGTYLIVDYGQLDGQTIDWSQYKMQGVVSVVVFSLILVIGLLLLKISNIEKMQRIAGIVAFCIFLMQSATLFIVVINSRNAVVDTDYVVTSKNYGTYSAKENVVMIVLDAFDSRVLNDLYNGEQQERIDDVFEDFTFYKNTSNVMNNTELSIPQIITGRPYLNETTFWEYLDEAYAQSPLLNELIDNDYSLNIYTNVHIPQGDVSSKVDNWSRVNMSVSSHRRLFEYIYKVLGFRYLPQPLKKYCWVYSDDQFDLQEIDYLDGSEDLASFSWGNQTFAEYTKEIDLVNDKPMFHFYHIKGLHVPRDCDEFFNPVVGDAGFEVTAKSVFNVLDDYFDELRTKQIYDDAIIVIMADHGAHEYDGTYMKQTPVLLVKGRNERHEFVVNDSPISYEYLQTGYHNLLNGRNDLFSDVDKSKDRLMYIGEWTTSQLTKDGTGCEVFYEYKLPSDVYDTDAIEMTGRKFWR